MNALAVMKTILMTILIGGGVYLLISIGLQIWEAYVQNYNKKHEFDINYEKETRQPDLRVEDLTSGERGECLLAFNMNKLREYKRANFNTYFETNHRTTEADVILVHKTGVYVCESKNYEGTVRGGFEDRQWTQKVILKRKRKFYNPIKQNEGHIEAMRAFLIKRELREVRTPQIYSIIAFSSFTDVKIKNYADKNVYVCKYPDIKRIIQYIEKNMAEEDFLTKYEIDKLHWAFDTLSHRSEDYKTQHVNAILATELDLQKKAKEKLLAEKQKKKCGNIEQNNLNIPFPTICIKNTANISDEIQQKDGKIIEKRSKLTSSKRSEELALQAKELYEVTMKAANKE